MFAYLRKMGRILCLATLAAFGSGGVAAPVQAQYPQQHWQTATPEAYGWSREKLQLAEDYAKEIGALGDVIAVDGVIIAQWGNVTQANRLNSVRKSLISALYGIYVQEGKISLTATLADYGIDDYSPRLTDAERQATVEDLLKARSGVYHGAAYETKGMRAKRPARGSHGPGEFWFYNNWDFNALGTIFEQQTGQSVFAAFQEKIAGPLQLEDYSLAEQIYHKEDVSQHRAYLFHLSTRDMARFGLLYLQQGQWQGKQIVPADWVEKSLTAYSAPSREKGYGYLWWLSTNNKLLGVQLAGPGYYAHGHGGQLIVVVPYLKLVIAHTTPRGKDTAQEFEKLFQLIMAAKPN